jgi:tRNA nucleotidyltransferase (CCA-adding enzyme)
MNEIETPIGAVQIMKALDASGFKAYLVGGCVRDGLLGRIPKDFDIATSAKPDEMKQALRDFHTIETGIKHGTLTVMIEGESFEVTTFRIDGNYSDNRHPDSVEFVDDITSDLSRRDFTINAMAYNEADGIIDPFHGKDDLRRGLIRCVGLPDDRFQEDALRMLRAIRFASQLDFSVADSVKQGVANNCHLIQNVSKERISAEIVKILMSDVPDRYLWQLCASGLMEQIIPKLYDCFSIPQNNINHMMYVGPHILTSLHASPKDLIIRLALLLHDIGKAITRTTDDIGMDHFYGHEIESAKLAEEWLCEYKFPNDVIEDVTNLVLYHDYLQQFNKKSIKKLMNKISLKSVQDLLVVREHDIYAQGIEYRSSKLDELAQIRELVGEIATQNEAFQMKDLSVNGEDLLAMGFKQGRILGDCLKDLLDLVMEHPKMNDRDTLLDCAKDFLATSRK